MRRKKWIREVLDAGDRAEKQIRELQEQNELLRRERQIIDAQLRRKEQEEALVKAALEIYAVMDLKKPKKLKKKS